MLLCYFGEENTLFSISHILLIGEKIVKAAKEVAEEIGGDVKSTQSELLMKLLNPEETSMSKNLT